MAKIIIAGNACVVTSALTTEKLAKLKKYSPDSLVLRESEKDGAKAIFMVDTGCSGSVNQSGIVFDGTSHDGAKLATMTKVIPQGVSDVKQWVLDNVGTAIIKLNTLEEKLEGAYAAVEADEAKVAEAIEVVGAAE